MGFSLSEGDSRVCVWERSQGWLVRISWLWGELGIGEEGRMHLMSPDDDVHEVPRHSRRLLPRLSLLWLSGAALGHAERGRQQGAVSLTCR